MQVESYNSMNMCTFIRLKLEGLKLVASKLTMHTQTIKLKLDGYIQRNLGKWEWQGTHY